MGCRQVAFKQDLARLAASAGGVRVDWHGRLGGRGGYLHPRRACLELFIKAKVARFNSLGCGVERAERINMVNLLAERLAPNEAL